MKLKITILLALLCTTNIHAQEILWGVDMKAVFDNREYNTKLSSAETIFGATLAPEFGLRWDKKHSLMVEAYVTAEFGSPVKDFKVEPAFYYNFRDSRFNVSAGLVPFDQVIGTESRAFFSDSVRFFKNTIGGVLLQYVRGKNYAELYLDWNGRRSEVQREQFTIYSSGRFAKNVFFATYEFSMHHYAATSLSSGVTDNLWISPAVGVDLSHKIWLDSLTVSVAYLQSFQNDRRNVGHYVAPKGGEVSIRVEKCHVGIYNTFFYGDNMMPYYSRYGSDLYWGDPFYSTPNKFYNRTEIYWVPLRKKNFNLKIASIHHYDGLTWSWQQFVKFCVRIDQNLFKKNKSKES